MPRGLTGGAALVALAVACTGCGLAHKPQPTSPPTAAPAPTSAHPSPTSSDGPKVIATNLSVPWGLAFLPDGGALVTERDTGAIQRVTPQGQVSQAGKVAGVRSAGEGGLLGIAISPNFVRDRYVYVYYTSDTDNRIVRMRWSRTGHVNGAASAQDVLVHGIPSGDVHNGGRLAFGPDGMLYASTGETGRGSAAQDKKSLGGKILRMKPDGHAAHGNPFGTRVWSYGHRNVQGMAWDAKGRMYATEFGQDTYDELNRIKPGKNYGWPEVEGTGGGAKYTDPLLTWRPSDASPSGLAFAGGSLFAAALRGERLWRVPLSRSGTAEHPKPMLSGTYGRLRTVVPTSNGKALWVTTSNKDGRGEPNAGDDKIIMVPLKGKGGRGSPTPSPKKSGSGFDPSTL